uniref:PWWP domain containing 3A, DNA repair factor n=1 Tax=Canis lupus dingo TaxID=286419 RepID=A0A8C0KTA1_CANLU
MTDAQYVLCRWEQRLWPAKVLARTETSTKNKRKKGVFLSVQILSLDEKIEVRSTEVEILKTAHIERIASSLASQGEVPAEPLEELAYRRSLRVALDVLNQRTGLPPESSSREERTALSSREKPTELASSLCDPSSSCLREDVPSSSGPQRRERVHPRLSGSPTCRKDPKGKVDHKKELGKSGSPQALVVPSARGGSQDGGGSRTCCRSRTTPSKRGRSLAQEPSLCQRAPSVSEGDGEKESSLPTSGSPPRVREKGLCAKGEDPGLPWCGPAVLPAPGRPACPDAQGRPAKRPCPDGSQRLPATQLEPGAAPCPRQGPRGRMTLRSAAKLGLPAPCASTEETNLHILVEEDRQSSGDSMEFNPIHSILEEDEDDEEPPRILLYHEPRSFEVGMLVWLKHQKYPFWPAVVKSVRRRDKKASVLFIEGHMDPKGRGITVSLKRLKHFDCKEKQELLNEAKEDFDQAIGWCVSLITDYRVRLGCGSFAGSFLEYYAADISYPCPQVHSAGRLGDQVPPAEQGGPRGACGGEPPGEEAALQEGPPRPLPGRPGPRQPEAGGIHRESQGRRGSPAGHPEEQEAVPVVEHVPEFGSVHDMRGDVPGGRGAAGPGGEVPAGRLPGDGQQDAGSGQRRQDPVHPGCPAPRSHHLRDRGGGRRGLQDGRGEVPQGTVPRLPGKRNIR